MNARPWCATCRLVVLLGTSLAGAAAAAADEAATVRPANRTLPGGAAAWEAVFTEEFSGTADDLAERWEVHHGPSTHTLCSRWRENMEVQHGQLHIRNRKESRGGQAWTSGSMRTKETFTGGYFECRYRYANAPATNNSFWLMTKRGKGGPPREFEIDVNEGHVPGDIRTNVHDWGKPHRAFEERIVLGSPETAALGRPDLGRTFHVYGLEWNAKELVWWFDGHEIRRLKNTVCHGPAHVYLSCAIQHPPPKSPEKVTDAIDGTHMDVDWVRVFRRRPDAGKPR